LLDVTVSTREEGGAFAPSIFIKPIPKGMGFFLSPKRRPSCLGIIFFCAMIEQVKTEFPKRV
jgi:hypothetical protein